MRGRAGNLIGKWFSHPAHDEETRRRCILFASFLLVLTPSFYTISVINFCLGRAHESLPTFVLATVMLFLLGVLRNQRSIVIPFRTTAALSLITMAYLLSVNAGDGHVFVWFYCYPMVIFFVAGHRSGLFWVVAPLVISAWIFFLTPAREFYGAVTSIRFLLTYFITAAVAYKMESSRTYYYQELLEERNSLREAMLQIKTLRGLLPICASCKSVRDDKGYWSKIETYLNQNTEAQFTHGICPSCMKKLYPTAFADMVKSGQTSEQTPTKAD